jgi:AAA15 family ATPase/GTPase
VEYRAFDEDDYEVGDEWLEKHKVTIPYRHVPTHLLPGSELKVMWNEISATSSSKRVIEALRIIEPKVEGLTFKPVVKRVKKNSIEKIEEVPFINIGNDQLVPLKRSGEGMSRLLQLVLSMIHAKGGFLFLDEFENGLHYSVQPKVWQLLMELATKLDVQVFATTHDWDCVKSLQQASEEVSSTEVFLFHLGRSMAVDERKRVIATEYDSEELRTATHAELEVR